MTQPDEDRTAHGIDTPRASENPHARHAVFPPPPWTLRGAGVLGPRLVEVARARPFVPPELRVVHVLPGRTAGGLYLARYGPGSTLEYGEVIVVAALVRRGWQVGAWVSHIYLDSAESLAGGRAVWGLPKQMADCDWEEGRAAVQQDGREVCSVEYEPRGGGLPLGFPLPAFGLPAGRLARFTAHARARVLPMRAPAYCPCAPSGRSHPTARSRRSASLVPARRCGWRSCARWWQRRDAVW